MWLTIIFCVIAVTLCFIGIIIAIFSAMNLARKSDLRTLNNLLKGKLSEQFLKSDDIPDLISSLNCLQKFDINLKKQVWRALKPNYTKRLVELLIKLAKEKTPVPEHVLSIIAQSTSPNFEFNLVTNFNNILSSQPLTQENILNTIKCLCFILQIPHVISAGKRLIQAKIPADNTQQRMWTKSLQTIAHQYTEVLDSFWEVFVEFLHQELLKFTLNQWQFEFTSEDDEIIIVFFSYLKHYKINLTLELLQRLIDNIENNKEFFKQLLQTTLKTNIATVDLLNVVLYLPKNFQQYTNPYCALMLPNAKFNNNQRTTMSDFITSFIEVNLKQLSPIKKNVLQLALPDISAPQTLCKYFLLLLNIAHNINVFATHEANPAVSKLLTILITTKFQEPPGDKILWGNLQADKIEILYKLTQQRNWFGRRASLNQEEIQILKEELFRNSYWLKKIKQHNQMHKRIVAGIKQIQQRLVANESLDQILHDLSRQEDTRPKQAIEPDTIQDQEIIDFFSHMQLLEHSLSKSDLFLDTIVEIQTCLKLSKQQQSDLILLIIQHQNPISMTQAIVVVLLNEEYTKDSTYNSTFNYLSRTGVFNTTNLLNSIKTDFNTYKYNVSSRFLAQTLIQNYYAIHSWNIVQLENITEETNPAKSQEQLLVLIDLAFYFIVMYQQRNLHKLLTNSDTTVLDDQCKYSLLIQFKQASDPLQAILDLCVLKHILATHQQLRKLLAHYILLDQKKSKVVNILQLEEHHISWYHTNPAIGIGKLGRIEDVLKDNEQRSAARSNPIIGFTMM